MNGDQDVWMKAEDGTSPRTDAIRDNLDGEALGIASQFFAGLPVVHDTNRSSCMSGFMRG